LELGDWGGSNNAPYQNPSQIEVSTAMATTATEINAQYVIALGDNFYSYGISSTCEDPRFEETWNSVYTAQSLMIPWIVLAGNHDHRGNVSAQIAYSATSDRWVFPSLYHKHSLFSTDKKVSIDLIMMDTTNYTGINKGDVYPSTVADLTQQVWLEEALSTSTATYIIVAGHYPVYSVCEHGNTETLVVNLKPLLEKYEAHYFSGHDHCAEHIVVENVNYWLNGMGHGCCYQSSNLNEVPANGLLKFLFANQDLSKEIDDDHVEVGVNGTVGGYCGIVASKDSMTVSFYSQDSSVLYSSSVKPRSSAATDDTAQNSSKKSEFTWFVACVAVSGAAMVFIAVFWFYKEFVSKNKNIDKIYRNDVNYNLLKSET
jgi:hypothetical protein